LAKADVCDENYPLAEASGNLKSIILEKVFIEANRE